MRAKELLRLFDMGGIHHWERDHGYAKELLDERPSNQLPHLNTHSVGDHLINFLKVRGRDYVPSSVLLYAKNFLSGFWGTGSFRLERHQTPKTNTQDQADKEAQEQNLDSCATLEFAS